MKQLRVLTGVHAGARLTLERLPCTVGCAEEADVQVSDWTQATARLDHDPDTDMMRLTTFDDAGTACATPFADFMPRRFADVVLCIGDDDATWPGDIELMSRLLVPRADDVTVRESPRSGWGPRKRTVAVVGSIACVTLLGTFGALVMPHDGGAEAHTRQQPLQERVANALRAAGLTELEVRPVGDKVAVEGLITAAADLTRVRAALRVFEHGAVLHRYAAASELSQAISDAFSDPRIHVRYAGHGVFVVDGSVLDVERLSGSAGRIAADLGPLVRRIDIAANALPPEQRVHVDAMLVTSGLRYVQTRDGTKHLIVSSTEDLDVESGLPLH